MIHKVEKPDQLLDMTDIEVINNVDKKYIILVEKESGAWTTLNKSSQYIVKDILKQKVPLGKFIETYPKDISLINQLYNSGILKYNNQTNSKKFLMDKRCAISKIKTIHIVIRYTKKCNLSCTYCYAYDGTKQHMTNRMVISILDKISDTYPDRKINLSIHGGEPLIRYKDLTDLVKSIKITHPNVNLFIQTNGTLITKDIASFLKDENFNVGVSLDGFNEETNLPRCQNNGESSFMKSLIGLQNLISAGVIPGLFTVVTPTNQYQLLKHFDYFVEIGIRKFNFCPIIPAGRASNNNDKMDIKNLSSTYIELIKKINYFNSGINDYKDFVSEMNSTNILNNLSSYFGIYNLCTLSPCGAGKTLLAFDTDGTIYPCDDFVGESSFKIGNILDLIDLKNTISNINLKQGLYNRDVNNIPECKACPWKRICVFHCASDPYYNHGTFKLPHSMCDFSKLVIPKMIDLLYNKQIEPRNIIPC